MAEPNKNVRMSLTKVIIAAILLDRFIFAPLRVALKRKGPLVKITFGKRGRYPKGKKKGANVKTKIFGWTIGAIVGIGVIAVLASSVWHAIKGKVMPTTPTV